MPKKLELFLLWWFVPLFNCCKFRFSFLTSTSCISMFETAFCRGGYMIIHSILPRNINEDPFITSRSSRFFLSIQRASTHASKKPLDLVLPFFHISDKLSGSFNHHFKYLSTSPSPLEELFHFRLENFLGFFRFQLTWDSPNWSLVLPVLGENYIPCSLFPAR